MIHTPYLSEKLGSPEKCRNVSKQRISLAASLQVERTRKQLIASSKKCQPAAAGPSTNDEPIGCSERESGISEAGSQAEESLPVSIPASQTGCHHSRGTSSKVCGCLDLLVFVFTETLHKARR